MVIRTNHEIENIIRNCPFGSVNLVEDGTKVLVTFLSSAPQEVTASDIQKICSCTRKISCSRERGIPLLPQWLRKKANYQIIFLRKKLKVDATTRKLEVSS